MNHDTEFDAGEMACGELVVELRKILRRLRPGQILKLRALDPGAPVDLPAYCRLTRNPLVESKPPFFWIERKRD